MKLRTIAWAVLAGIAGATARADGPAGREIGAELASLLLADAPAGATVRVVLPVGSGYLEGPLGRQLRAGAEGAITGAHCCTVVARDHEQEAIEEQQHSLSDLFDGASRAPMGALKGASHVLGLEWELRDGRLAVDGRLVAVATGEGGRASKEFPTGERLNSVLRDGGTPLASAIADLMPGPEKRRLLVLPFESAAGFGERRGADLADWVSQAMPAGTSRLDLDSYLRSCQRAALPPELPENVRDRRLVQELGKWTHQLRGRYWETDGGWELELALLDVATRDVTKRRARVLRSELPADLRDAPDAAEREERGRISSIVQGLGQTEVHPLSLEAWADRGTKAVYRDGDPMQIAIRGRGLGWLYVYSIDSAEGVTRLFPNRFSPDPCVDLGRGVVLGDEASGFALTAQEPYGTDTVHVYASDREFEPAFEAAVRAGGTPDFREVKTRGFRVEAPSGQTKRASRCKPDGPGAVEDRVTLTVTTGG